MAIKKDREWKRETDRQTDHQKSWF